MSIAVSLSAIVYSILSMKSYSILVQNNGDLTSIVIVAYHPARL